MSKRCTRCDREKPLTEFHRYSRSSDGRQSCCKACHVDANRISRLAHRDTNQDRHRLYQERHGVEATARKAAWRRANPEKRQAHNAVYRALRAGRLTRPDRCDDCGQTAKVHAHHADYAAWLDVAWICSPCHGLRHMPERAA